MGINILYLVTTRLSAVLHESEKDGGEESTDFSLASWTSKAAIPRNGVIANLVGPKIYIAINSSLVFFMAMYYDKSSVWVIYLRSFMP